MIVMYHTGIYIFFFFLEFVIIIFIHLSVWVLGSVRAPSKKVYEFVVVVGWCCVPIRQ